MKLSGVVRPCAFWGLVDTKGTMEDTVVCEHSWLETRLCARSWVSHILAT